MKKAFFITALLLCLFLASKAQTTIRFQAKNFTLYTSSGDIDTESKDLDIVEVVYSSNNYLTVKCLKRGINITYHVPCIYKKSETSESNIFRLAPKSGNSELSYIQLNNEIYDLLYVKNNDGKLYSWSLLTEKYNGNMKSVKSTERMINWIKNIGTTVPPVSSSTQQPDVTIQKVWTEHSVYVDGQKGMKIHAQLNIRNRKGHKIKMVAYFYYEKGGKLKDNNGVNRTSEGNVSTSITLTPTYDHSFYEDADLFLPYDELHLGSGHFDLKYFVNVFDMDNNTEDLAESDWVYITYN